MDWLKIFLQASEQLQDTGITLFKDRLPDTPTIAEWLGEVLHSGDKVGIDGWVNTVAEVESLRISLASKELQLVSVDDPFNLLWEDRPLYLKAHRLFYLWNTVACLVPISWL